MATDQVVTSREPMIVTALGVVLWIYLAINVLTLTVGSFQAHMAKANLESSARIHRSQGNVGDASEEEIRAIEGHRDHTSSASAAWVGIGLSLVGLSLIHGRRG